MGKVAFDHHATFGIILWPSRTLRRMNGDRVSGAVGLGLAVMAALFAAGAAIWITQTRAAKSTPEPVTVTIASSPTRNPSVATSAPSETPVGTESIPAVVLVRRSGAMDETVGPKVADLDSVALTSTVNGGSAALLSTVSSSGATVDEAEQGWEIPIDVTGIDPVTYAALLPSEVGDTVALLTRGTALLSETSARLRRLDVGSTMRLDGLDVEVVAILEDHYIRSAEIVLHHDDAAALGLELPRFVLAGGDNEEQLLQDVERAFADEDRTLVRNLGRAPWTQRWRLVTPQAVVKEQFGEFAVRSAAGGTLTLTPHFVKDNIRSLRVPILGTVRCHRAMLPHLEAAMTELVDSGLDALVDASDYAGCYYPRRMGTRAAVSRHAWGLAVDLNATTNPYGYDSQQDPRLVEIMQSHGFVFGGDWPTPDPMHFEYVGDVETGEDLDE